MQLDLLDPSVSAARVLRDAGMETAARHADAVVDGWSDRAYAFLAGAPSVLVAYGYENRGALMSSEIPGKFICLMGGRHEKA